VRVLAVGVAAKALGLSRRQVERIKAKVWAQANAGGEESSVRKPA